IVIRRQNSDYWKRYPSRFGKSGLFFFWIHYNHGSDIILEIFDPRKFLLKRFNLSCYLQFFRLLQRFLSLLQIENFYIIFDSVYEVGHAWVTARTRITKLNTSLKHNLQFPIFIRDI